MCKSRFTEERIMGILKESEAGAPMPELCRKHESQRRRCTGGRASISINPTIYHKWLKDFMEAGKARLRGATLREASGEEVKALRQENERLKQRWPI